MPDSPAIESNVPVGDCRGIGAALAAGRMVAIIGWQPTISDVQKASVWARQRHRGFHGWPGRQARSWRDRREAKQRGG
jgi:hypothetical protein